MTAATSTTQQCGPIGRCMTSLVGERGVRWYRVA